MADRTVLHIINDLRTASAAELIAYSLAGPNVLERAPGDVDAFIWASAAVVLVEADVVPALVDRVDLFHRGHVTLIAHDINDPMLWTRAAQVGAQRVALLPEATPWLVDEIRHTCNLAAS